MTATSSMYDALIEACLAAEADDLTDQCVLADWLEESGDDRAAGLRRAIRLWEQARKIRPDPDAPDWSLESMQCALRDACATQNGWDDVCLLGCLVAYHAPSGEPGKTLGQTAGCRAVAGVQKTLWFIAAGVLDHQQAYAAQQQADAARQQADAARQQADAAWQQADAAWQQAYAAQQQADAAWQQAYAVWRQADAARQQAYTAHQQADAARQQAYAAYQQAYTAKQQAHAAWQQVWRWARACWEMIRHTSRE